MRPPYDVLNLYHVIRLNWSSFLNRPRARARTLASFASYIAYSLGLARSHYCARPMRFGLKASTEKAWKDDASPYKFYSPCISYQSLGSRSFFSLACADVRREMCAECTTATKFFASAFLGPGQYKDLLQNRKPRMLCIQCRHNMGRHLRE